MPFALALLSSALYGAADFLGGISARRGPLVTVTAWAQLVGVLPLLLFALLAPGVTRAPDLLWGVAAGASGGAGVLLLYSALASGTVSTAAPLISMIALCVPVAVGLLSGERPGVLPLVGVVLAGVAVVLLSGGHGAAPEPHAADTSANTPRTRRALALLQAVASGVLIGIFLVCVGRIGPGASGWPLLAGRLTATLGTFAALLAIRGPFAAPRAAVAPILGTGLADVAANVLYLVAVQRGPLSLIATLVSLAPATTVVLAQFVLHERLGAAQRWGIAIALVAVVLLSQGR
jgi:drug/metabolite transporter (DMT)-like permease